MKISKLIAHRGASEDAPENTMAAFKKAYESGFKWIELDVQMSIDGILFIFHDADTKRLTGVENIARELPFSALQKLHILAGQFDQFASIPSLVEYLDWMSTLPDLHTNLEIKIHSPINKPYQAKLIEKLLLLLEDYPLLHDRLLLSSFSEYALSVINDSKTKIARSFLLYITEEWAEVHEDIFGQIKARFEAFNCFSLGINHLVLTEKRLRELKEHFNKVLVYTVGTVSDDRIRSLLHWGADSVFVNATTILTEPKQHSVGFLSTGDEITTGDVLNTNTPRLAEQIYRTGLDIGLHLSCSDDDKKLTTSLKFLLEQHDIVITTGGLGPTEDDKTAAIIASVFNRPLVLSELSWQRIQTRVLKRFDYVPENNKKQALFPKDARILINQVGTADGCYVMNGDKHLFMLPGPPHECLPMFERDVLPILKRFVYVDKPEFLHWQLIGASEAHIAQQLEPISHQYHVNLGYRAAYPYLEIKLHHYPIEQQSALCEAIEEVVSPYLVGHDKRSASQKLQSYLQSDKVFITMQKDVTKGYVYSHLAAAQPLEKPKDVELSIMLKTEGLTNFWQKNEEAVDSISVILEIQNNFNCTKSSYQKSTQYMLKGKHGFRFVYEWICTQIIQVIEQESK